MACGCRELSALLLWESRLQSRLLSKAWAVVGIDAAGEVAVEVASCWQCCCGSHELTAVLL